MHPLICSGISLYCNYTLPLQRQLQTYNPSTDPQTQLKKQTSYNPVTQDQTCIPRLRNIYTGMRSLIYTEPHLHSEDVYMNFDHVYFKHHTCVVNFLSNPSYLSLKQLEYYFP